ncbi:hypothetical protein [Verrucomicrobium spinosum]|uniref:hypothetical protein n=1 Tax=Verrucomicrobium spinosum TaxID=2736 RepID=UPI0009463991|nr:hypothetical protein [Verrucomicrobium spinosum]
MSKARPDCSQAAPCGSGSTAPDHHQEGPAFLQPLRPANETYLYGFRKHEQGQNAAEIERFDPLVTAEDDKIHEQKVAALEAAKRLP